PKPSHRCRLARQFVFLLLHLSEYLLLHIRRYWFQPPIPKIPDILRFSQMYLLLFLTLPDICGNLFESLQGCQKFHPFGTGSLDAWKKVRRYPDQKKITHKGEME